MITQEELKKNLQYNSSTGLFTWKSTNKAAGTLKSSGYITIGVNRKYYYAQRLAWLYVHGYFPENQVDHKDQVKHHNWIDNLREATNTCNSINKGLHKNNTSGVKGVSWCKPMNKWLSMITVKGKRKRLGLFADFTEAVKARLTAEQCLKYENCILSSSAYEYMSKQ